MITPSNQVVLRLPRGSRGTVLPGLIDDAAIRAFTMGQCHGLALALHERTGWTLAIGVKRVPIPRKGPEPAPRTLARVWLHAMVETPDKTYIDINGESTADDLFDQWDDDDEDDRMNDILYVKPDFLERMHLYKGGVKPNLPVARTFVDPILAKVGRKPDGSRT